MLSARLSVLCLCACSLVACQMPKPAITALPAIPRKASVAKAAVPGRLSLQIRLSQLQLPLQGFATRATTSPYAYAKVVITHLTGETVAATPAPVALVDGALDLTFGIDSSNSYYLVRLDLFDAERQPLGGSFKGYFRYTGQGTASPQVQLSWLSTPVAETLEVLGLQRPELVTPRLVGSLEGRINQFLIVPETRTLAKYPSALDAQALAAQILATGEIPTVLDPALYKPGRFELKVKGMIAFFPKQVSVEVPLLGTSRSFTANGLQTLELPPGVWPLKYTMPAGKEYYGVPQAASVSIVAGQATRHEIRLVLSPGANPLSQSKVELGYRLFFEPRLSGNQQMSCASCHDPNKGFSNGEANAAGITGARGTRNVPTLYGVGQFSSFFLDGRSPSLEHQALQPIQNPIEMNANLSEVLALLAAVPYYPAKFQEAFGTGVTANGLADALASFERVLSLRDGVFERRDEPGFTGFSEPMRRGYELFKNKARCTLCHQEGELFTNFGFNNIGIGMDADQPDPGVFGVTHQAADFGKFKDTPLRNLTRTAPYMHDGSAASLEEVVDYYNTGGTPNPALDGNMAPLNLSDQEKADLVAFLKSLDAPDNLASIGQLPGIRAAGEVLPFLPGAP